MKTEVDLEEYLGLKAIRDGLEEGKLIFVDLEGNIEVLNPDFAAKELKHKNDRVYISYVNMKEDLIALSRENTELLEKLKKSERELEEYHDDFEELSENYTRVEVNLAYCEKRKDAVTIKYFNLKKSVEKFNALPWWKRVFSGKNKIVPDGTGSR